jgi:hypothetical protein
MVETKNAKGETAKDIVSKEWDAQLAKTYEGVGGSLNREFDLPLLQKIRPQIASLLERHTSATTEDSAPPK